MGRAITARAGSGPARFGSDTSATPAVRAIGSGRPRPASNRGPGAPSALSACLRACATAMRSRRRAELAAERLEYSCRGRDLPLIVKVGRRGVRLLGLRQHGASGQCTTRREGGRGRKCRACCHASCPVDGDAFVGVRSLSQPNDWLSSSVAAALPPSAPAVGTCLATAGCKQLHAKPETPAYSPPRPTAGAAGLCGAGSSPARRPTGRHRGPHCRRCAMS
jgi:hypothetical protein